MKLTKQCLNTMYVERLITISNFNLSLRPMSACLNFLICLLFIDLAWERRPRILMTSVSCHTCNEYDAPPTFARKYDMCICVSQE